MGGCRFGHVAAQLLSVPRVRLYQDSTFMKRSGDGPTLWHSDLNMAPFDTNDVVSSRAWPSCGATISLASRLALNRLPACAMVGGGYP